jgi:glycosyltransferase involved in cell wall biosynthesis
MFRVYQNMFGVNKKITDDTKVIFVADYFTEHYNGGAELTLQALINAAPTHLKTAKLQSKDLDLITVKENLDKFWIFGNFSEIQDTQVLSFLMQNAKYAVVECDYKFCKYRSIEKHIATEGNCDCANTGIGKFIKDFFLNARQIFWMSQAQKEVYDIRFTELAEKKHSEVLSSVFDKSTLDTLEKLKETPKNENWLVLGSPSWVKGFESAKKYCEENNLKYEVVWNLPYEQMLQKLAASKGVVYLPAGADTCPRLIIEAKLLGCELVLNENVQHAHEKWFETSDLSQIKTYLSTTVSRFWERVIDAMYRVPKISGYVTTYNCIKQSYPYENCIKSLLRFCSEVCVVDGGSNDGTWEYLTALAAQNPAVKIKQIIRDWSSPRFSVFDGMQKAEARAMCSGDFCWQADVDEVFHEDDVKLTHHLCFVTHADIVALPVIEYWGGPNKVRLDVTPWKWRLTRNKPYITHGIPKELRRNDKDGNLYSLPGSDGCDFIHKDTFERIPFVSFYTQEADNARIRALQGDMNALRDYEQWINNIVKGLPAAYHYSWYDIERKIRLYRDYWQKHWDNLANNDEGDTATNNKFFDVPWSEVTDDMIKVRAKELANNTGGHIFHSKWMGQNTPSIRCYKMEPKV